MRGRNNERPASLIASAYYYYYVPEGVKNPYSYTY